jgi:hypothetical protein
MTAALRAALPWECEGDSGRSRNSGAVRRLRGRETKGSHYFVELLGVVTILDLRIHGVSLHLAIDADPKSHAERQPAELFGWCVEREGHIPRCRGTSLPTFSSRAGPSAPSGPGSSGSAGETSGTGTGPRSRCSSARIPRLLRHRRRSRIDRLRRNRLGGLRLGRWFDDRLGNWDRGGRLRDGALFGLRDWRQGNIRHPRTAATALGHLTKSGSRWTRRHGPAPEPVPFLDKDADQERMHYQRCRQTTVAPACCRKCELEGSSGPRSHLGMRVSS